jgi:ABC-type uncharacterized transport system permease subunit
MPVRSEWLVLYGAVVALYLLVAWREWGALSGSAERLPVWLSGALALAFVLHGILLWQAIIGSDQFHFGFAYALSATLWLTVLIVWAESYYSASRGLLLLVLPLAALASGLPVIFPGSVLGPATASIVFRLHLVLAILAYSLLTIAAMQALLMATMDRRLHGDLTSQRTALARFLDRLPPLLAMETVLFRLITAGFLLLTATLVSGVFFSEQLFGRPLRFDHKTVFTIAAWLVFGGLLAGRLFFGWRGRTALRWTLIGFAMLMLAYVGSRFVMEVLLGRT